jgi:hypothetical protein
VCPAARLILSYDRSPRLDFVITSIEPAGNSFPNFVDCNVYCSQLCSLRYLEQAIVLRFFELSCGIGEYDIRHRIKGPGILECGNVPLQTMERHLRDMV